jgi:hypothetical protein
MCIMGLYLLSEGVHGTFDQELLRFIWHATNGRQNYHMVKWADICDPKELGGMGIFYRKRQPRPVWRCREAPNPTRTFLVALLA